MTLRCCVRLRTPSRYSASLIGPATAAIRYSLRREGRVKLVQSRTLMLLKPAAAAASMCSCSVSRSGMAHPYSHSRNTRSGCPSKQRVVRMNSATLQGPDDIERVARKRRAGEVSALEPDFFGQAAPTRDTASLVDLALRERDPHDPSAEMLSEPEAAPTQTASRVEHPIAGADPSNAGEGAIGVLERLGMAHAFVVMESEVKREVAPVQPDRAIVEQRLLVGGDRRGGPAESRASSLCLDALVRDHPDAPSPLSFFAPREKRAYATPFISFLRLPPQEGARQPIPKVMKNYFPVLCKLTLVMGESETVSCTSNDERRSAP